jgi:hypothetical protein
MRRPTLTPGCDLHATGRALGWLEQHPQWYGEAFRQFPGLELEIVQEISRGNEVALERKTVLTEPAGVRHPLLGVNVARVEHGRYREVRADFDASKLQVSVHS